MNDKELIEEARRQVEHVADKSMREHLIGDLADVLAARQPSADERQKQKQKPIADSRKLRSLLRTISEQRAL